jgi:hypothetical protein
VSCRVVSCRVVSTRSSSPRVAHSRRDDDDGTTAV